MRLQFPASLLLSCALLAGFPAPAPAQDAPEFFLDLDTGGHRAVVRDIVFTPDGELLLSASDDKTIRIWDWQAGVTLRIIRGQIGQDDEGKILAIDVSPDGETVAAAGYFGPGFGDQPPYGDVRLFDLSAGRMEAVLAHAELPVYDLDFSPDGSHLAVAGQDGEIHLWVRDEAEAQGWRFETALAADSWTVAQVAFALGGERIVATTLDDGLRLWTAGGEAIDLADAGMLAGMAVRGLAVSPDGTRFATGSDDGGIHLWSAEDGALLRSFPQQDFMVGALAFTADGASLVASCFYPCTDGEGAFAWSLDGGDEPAVSYQDFDNTISAGAAAPAGTLVATAGGTQREIHVWDAATGEQRKLLVGSGRPVTGVAVDDAATVLAWGSENPCPDQAACPDLFAGLENRILLPTQDRGFADPEPYAGEGAGLLRARHQDGDWSLRAAEGGDHNLPNAVLEIAQGGELLHEIENDATTGYLHASFTLLSDGATLVTGGSDGTMIAYDRETGDFVHEFVDGHTGEVHAMAEAPAAKRLVTGSADQTLRLWNLETRQLIVSLFAADGEWIVWTPQGYYHSSPNGDALVGWHINQGEEQEARYIKARQLRQHLHSPEIVRRAIITGDAAGAARELRGTDTQLAELLQRKPPEFSVRIAEGVRAADGFVAIEIIGAAEAGADVESFAIMSNERRVTEIATRAVDGDRIIIEVPVRDGENDILITGANEYGYLTERSVKALAKVSAEEKPKGKLYVLAVGVNDYPHLPKGCGGRPCDLRFPVADASEFLLTVAERTAPLHSGMEALLLVNREALDADPERADAIDALIGPDRVLEPESETVSDHIMDFLDLPGEEDTTIIFIAGHGINIEEDYYFIPTDGRKAEEDRWRRSSLVDWYDVQRSIERAEGRRLMLLDTCHAANAFNPRLEKNAADARIVVLSATGGDNTAQELAQLGHGVFTHAVLEGMRGAANSSGDGVRILGLADFIDREVLRLTSKQQNPFYHIAHTDNFLVAVP